MIRVRVAEQPGDWQRQTVSVYISREGDFTPAAWIPATGEWRALTDDERTGVAIAGDAVLHLPEDAAHLLLEELMRHFHGVVGDARALRKDYDAERARVDRLIGALIPGTP